MSEFRGFRIGKATACTDDVIAEFLIRDFLDN